MTRASGRREQVDAPQPPTSTHRVVDISFPRLATTLIAFLALMLSVGALVVAANKNDTTAVQQGSVEATSAVLDAKAIPAGASPVSLKEFSFDPKMVMATKGGALKVANDGGTQHTLSIEGTTLVTPTLEPSNVAGLSLASLAPGNYTVVCTIPGHLAAGMTGELMVMADGATHAAGTGAATSADAMDAEMAVRTKAFPAKTEGLGAQLLPPTVLADGTKQFDLTAKIVDWVIEPGKTVKAWGYNGVVPGPTLKVEIGDKVKVVINNELPESTSIHFHGLLTPNAMDGVPDITQTPIKPGTAFTYAFTARGPAVGMYHSHQNAVTQVPNGLAGAFLIGQEPVPDGVKVAQELPMMLNDAGTIGLTLNGKSFPATAPVVTNLGDYVMVHYLNEGVMAHPMHLHGMVQKIIAKDGIPLAQPYEADTVVVSPGERYTVLIHADAPGVWAWHCHILTHAESAQGMFGMVTAMIVQ
jgi:FtsP/CotA-like multicopper oxidase with cupredoxin domain